MRFVDHAGFAEGMRLYNAGAYWDAHEAWETLWRAEQDPIDRAALQGLIQIAAAFHKLFVTRDPAAAARLLAKGRTKLDGLPGDYLGIDLDAFRREASLSVLRPSLRMRARP